MIRNQDQNNSPHSTQIRQNLPDVWPLKVQRSSRKKLLSLRRAQWPHEISLLHTCLSDAGKRHKGYDHGRKEPLHSRPSSLHPLVRLGIVRGKARTQFDKCQMSSRVGSDKQKQQTKPQVLLEAPFGTRFGNIIQTLYNK